MECPACVENGVNTILQLYQVNLKQAAYRCTETFCEYSKESNWIYIQRDIFSNVFKVDNDSTDSDIETITKLFTNRVRKKIKKKYRTETCFNNVQNESDSNDEEVISKAYNILLGNLLEKENDDVKMLDKYLHLLDCDISEICAEEKIISKNLISDTKLAQDKINDDSLNFVTKINNIDSTVFNPVTEDSKINNCIDSGKIETIINKNDIANIHVNSRTICDKQEVSKTTCNDISTLLMFDDLGENLRDNEKIEEINCNNKSILEINKNRNISDKTTNDMSKLLEFTLDMSQNVQENNISELNKDNHHTDIDKIKIKNLQVDKISASDLYGNAKIKNVVNNMSEKQESQSLITSLNIVRDKKEIHNISMQVPIKIKVLHSVNLTKSKTKINNLSNWENVDNIIPQENSLEAIQFDIQNMPIMFDNSINSQIISEKSNIKKTNIKPERLKEFRVPEKSKPDNKPIVCMKNLQTVVRPNNVRNIIQEQKKAFPQMISKTKSNKIFFVKSFDDIMKIKEKNSKKTKLTKADIAAALKISCATENSKNTDIIMKPTPVTSIKPLIQGTKKSSTATKFEGFSFTSKIIKPANICNKNEDNGKKTASKNELSQAAGKDNSELKLDCVPTALSPEKSANTSVLDDLLKDINLDITNLTHTENDCGLEDVDDWLKSLVN